MNNRNTRSSTGLMVFLKEVVLQNHQKPSFDSSRKELQLKYLDKQYIFPNKLKLVSNDVTLQILCNLLSYDERHDLFIVEFCAIDGVALD